jgi:hypothetical protein
MRALQGEIGFFIMIECALFPRCYRVTVAAFFPLLAIVHIRFLVAAVTVLRSFMVFLFRFVAGCTICFRMHAF